MKTGKNFIIFLMSVCILASCSSTKHLPEGDKLYTESTIAVNGPNLPVRTKKIIKEDLEGFDKAKAEIQNF
jgi:hypothetical protein